MTENTLLSLGHGYSALAIGRDLLAQGWRVIGTSRSAQGAERIQQKGSDALIWPGAALPLDAATHLLTSVAPNDAGDPVLSALGAELRAAPNLRWIGYLSTIGVYGDHEGEWVNENSALRATQPRGIARIQAESDWSDLAREMGIPLQIFRLAGIYGPGRGPFEKLRAGRAQRVIKPGQVFSRIHRDDIASAVIKGIASDVTGVQVYNLCDDEPAPPQDVLGYAASLLGLPPPPEVPFEQADLSPMARSFYADSKRVSNERIKRDLGFSLRYPDYRAGLRAILDAETC